MKRREFLVVGAALVMPGCKREPPPDHFSPSSMPPAPSTIVTRAHAQAAPQLTARPLRFTDVTRASGVRWEYENGATGRHLYIETIGGGVALFDYNNDGLLDIFAVQGGPVPGATGKERRFNQKSVLYRNNGDGTFTDVTVAAGLGTISGYGQGVSAADYNNDGWTDLYVTTYGGNHLFHNNGDGAFTEVTTEAGVADLSPELPWPLSSAWADYDNDGFLDLFVCHYTRWSRALNRGCLTPNGKPAYCPPKTYDPSHSRLYHNNGDGTFTDVSEQAGIHHLWGKSMGAAWIDYDDDGWMDLFVTNDTMPNFLLHNNRNGTFTDVGMTSGVGMGMNGSPLAGMGIGVGDYNNDGREDLFVVNFAGEPKSVLDNRGNGIFINRAYDSNLGSSNLQFLGFGLECFDYDLDGFQDLIYANGHVMDDPASLGEGVTYAQSAQLFHNQHNGRFAEDLRSLGDLAEPVVGRGLAIGDYDNDGDIDVVIVAQNSPLRLLRNDGGAANHWITLRLEGVHANRDAIGAKVSVWTAHGRQTQWVRGGSSYCSQSDLRVTFGLADATEALRLVIRWPRGRVQKLGRLAADQFYWIREGAEAAPDPRVVSRVQPERQ
ncbi:MAG TPA: CRTAC1 family protein [Armatimonadota bacterium]|nr:CRTAC1 family protein [Armatimonadota bacterium]